MSTDTLMTLTEVRVRIGDAVLLDGVDLSVRSGEVLVLVGPNGAGKSTLLSVLSGDRTPDDGEARWSGPLDAPTAPGTASPSPRTSGPSAPRPATSDRSGSPLHEVRAAELARLRAVLLQDNQVSFPFRVVDVVRMGRAPWARDSTPGQDDAVVARSLRAADVDHLAARRYPTLSGGERARTSFARVLAQDTGLLLLDEPTAALDVRHTEQVLLQARRIADAGGAVVVVLHDLALAAAWADRVVVLDDGRVAGAGRPADVLTDDLLSRVYRHPVDVLTHPVTGGLLVLPRYAANRAVLSSLSEELP